MPAQAATATQGSVTVKVTAPGGAPIESASVAVTAVTGWDGDWGSTDSAGSFRTENLDPGSYNVEATVWTGGGHFTAKKTVTITANRDSAETLVVNGIQVLSGKVTKSGKALAKGSATVASSSGDRYYVEIKNGSYRALVAPGKTYTVEVYPEYPSRTYLGTYSGSTVRQVDATKINVTASAPATANIAVYAKLGKITGIVKDAKGKPVAGADVWVSATNRTGYGSATSAANGRYTIEGLPAGRYEVSASKGSSSSYNAAKGKSYTVKPGATTSTTVSIKAPAKGAITLKVKASSSVWKRSAGVCATAMTPKGVWVNSACADKKSKKLTIKGLAAGTYKVALNGTNQTYKIVVKKNRTTTRSVTRPTGTSVSGTVRSSSNKVLANAQVIISDANGTALGMATTSSKGRYTVPGAVKGTYVVDVAPAKASSGAYAGRKFTVKKGKKATANVRLVKGATISGKITTTSGKGIAGMSVYVVGANGYGYATTNAKGQYKVSGLLKGTYQVSSTDPYLGGYYNTKSTKVTVAAGKTKGAATLKANAG